MLKSNLQKWSKLVLIVAIWVVMAACSLVTPNSDSSPLQLTATVIATENFYIQDSAVVRTTFKEIVDNSQVILIGQPTSTKGILNTARNPNDPTKEDTHFFSISQVYEVKVENYLLGTGANTIYVIQNQGFIASSPKDLTETELEQVRKNSNTLPLSLGTRYIMFLVNSDYAYGNFQKEALLYGTGQPWRFEITDSGCVQLTVDVKELNRYFPSEPLDEFVKFIQDPTSFPEIPYPAPARLDKCVPETINPYP